MHKFIQIRNQFIFNLYYKRQFVELVHVIFGVAEGNARACVKNEWEL